VGGGARFAEVGMVVCLVRQGRRSLVPGEVFVLALVSCGYGLA
jgi:hypothetical protein